MSTSLSLDALRQVAPAAFGTEPSPEVSARYSFIPTYKLLEAAMDAGWEINRATQQIHQKYIWMNKYAHHRIVLRHPKIVPDRRLGLQFEIALDNSLDRSRRLRMTAGLFRQVCSNGLVIHYGGTSSINQLHLLDRLKFDDLLTNLSVIAKEAPIIYQMANKYQDIEMDVAARHSFGEDALVARYLKLKPTVSVAAILQPRRKEDEPNNLWCVFNRVQENLFKGGVQDAHHVTRPVADLVTQTKLNTKLWNLLRKYAGEDMSRN